jgi:fibronectin-binding autotransporter adhesin
MKTRRMNRPVRWLLTTWLLLSVLLTLARPARAANYAVTNLNDSGKGSLRQAILNANAAAGPDTITFSLSGTIMLTSTLPAISDAAGLSIDGTGRSITISGNDAVRVMWVNSGAALALHNLTVAAGSVNSNIGGGIYNAGTLSVTGSTFSGNSAYEGLGGGIANYGTLAVSDSAFSGNNSPVGGGILNFGSATVSDSTFSGNSGSGPDGGGGGGIANYGTLDVSNSTFSGNVGDNEGGGIFNRGTLSVTGSTFSDNGVGVFGTGGGIHNIGTLNVTGSTFSGNSAIENGQGGGI